MPTYSFFYDEAEHSRKINYKTISAANYYDNFVTMIVGWPDDKNDILQRHTAFEAKYADRKKHNGEIKSTTLQQKQFKYGFASLNKQNVQFVDDFLSLFDDNSHVIFSTCSKIEYLISQISQEGRGDFLIDADLIKYSITKALVMYRPKEIIKILDESPNDFLEALRKFLRNRIENNKKNPKLKYAETATFRKILDVLDTIANSPELSWDYHMPFDGFRKYLAEKNITDYRLIIDKEGKEGESSRTLKAAQKIGLNNLEEADSTEYSGLRMADMMAGIVSKLLKGLSNSLRYQSFEEGVNKKILDTKWFRLNETQLRLYKKLYWLICKCQPACYKSCSGIYSDDLIAFYALLVFMNQFESIEQIQPDIEMKGEYFNAFACEWLKEYFDSKRQPLLPLHEGFQTFDVLSVGMSQESIPTVTILKDGEPKCFRLPDELSEWVCYVVAVATMGINLFPAKMIFFNINGNYHVDIL